jgi:GNAT superfamily N-acetyltransferase
MPISSHFILLDKTQHIIAGFDCGKPTMNDFLTRFAIKHAQSGLSKTWVLSESSLQETKAKVIAYFTLAQCTVEKQALPFQKSLPNYPIPVVLLARIAIDLNYQKRGLGGKTLITALRKAYELCQIGLPAIGLILDVLDEEALTFYQSYGIFQPLTDNPRRLFVSMQTIAAL